MGPPAAGELKTPWLPCQQWSEVTHTQKMHTGLMPRKRAFMMKGQQEQKLLDYFAVDYWTTPNRAP